MVFFNYALRKLNTKIVYYGPGLCGKTTNLQWIHDHFEGGEKGKMVSLATEGDRTIFFDLLPLEIGTIRGMDVTLQLYTVPGQVHYNATRQLVLRGADGVVFVADSQRTMKNSNIDSLKNLEENLSLQGVNLSKFPHVLQFNKRDLGDIMGVEEMDEQLNEHSVPFFEATAIEGIGVEDTLGGIVKLVMRSLRDRYEHQADRLGTTTFATPQAPATPIAPTVPQAPAVPRVPTAAPTWGTPVTPETPSSPGFQASEISSPPPVSEPVSEEVKEDLLETRPTSEDEVAPEDEATGVYCFAAGKKDETSVDEDEAWASDEPTDPGLSLPLEGRDLSFDEEAEQDFDLADEVDTQTGVLFPDGEAEGGVDEVISEEVEEIPSFDQNMSTIAVSDGEESLMSDDVEEEAPQEESGTDPYADTIPPDYIKEEGSSSIPVSSEVEALVGSVLGVEEPSLPESPDTEGLPDFRAEAQIEETEESAGETEESVVEEELGESPFPEEDLGPAPTISDEGTTEEVEETPDAEVGIAEEAEATEEMEAMEAVAVPEVEEPAELEGGDVFSEPEELSEAEEEEPAVTMEAPISDEALEEAEEIQEVAGAEESGEAEPAAVEPAPEPEVEAHERRMAATPVFVDEGDPFMVVEEAPEVLAPAPVVVSPVNAMSQENSLALKLTGTGAIVESGEVRALDIEVPVPGSWIGNRRVTLQLRLTLSPAEEGEDE